MSFKSETKWWIEELRKRSQLAVENVNNVYGLLSGLRREFNALRDEIATNGVVRDLRKLEKENKQLRESYVNLEEHVLRRLEEIANNGVATAVNKLNKEVFSDKKEVPSLFGSSALISAMMGKEVEPDYAPTLAGQVKAIVDHLGLDFTVAPKEVKEAKVVAKKKSAPKKKGRR